MSVEPVLPLSALDRAGLSIAGGKAANLGELIRAGFPVPPGFCVTTAAYARVAEGSALAPVLDALAATLVEEQERLGAHAATARAALLDAPVSAELEHAFLAAYRALGEDVPVAVRSSATAEDLPDASFAGQQDTFLNVVGEAALLLAIRRCWASLFTERAVTYRAKHRIDPRAVQIAVVVQRMAPAQVAGVLFTANPVTGRRRRAVIDASPGLGEAVVSGAVNPDHFEVSAATGEVLERRLGDKRVAIESVPGGGTRRVEREAGAGACLSDRELAELARLGARVEAHYGAPQDLEWALDAGRKPWLLQARPITTLFPLPEGTPATDDELRVYFNASVAQGVYRPLTRMGLQAFRLIRAGMASAMGHPPPDRYRDRGLITDAAGRLMVDATRPLRSDVGRRLISFALSKMEARSAELVKVLLEDPRLPVVRTPRLWLLGRALRIAWRVLTLRPFARAMYQPETALALCHARGERILREHGAVAPGASPGARLDAVDTVLFHGVRAFVSSGGPVFFSGLICLKISRKVLEGIATDQEIDTVLRGLPNNPTTEMDLELWHLAERLRKDPDAAHALTSTPLAELARQDREGSAPAALRRELGAFLAVYGFRGVAEIDLGVPRWSDDPTHLLGVLSNYLALTEPDRAPDLQFRRGAVEAEAMVEALSLRARGAGWLRGKLTRFLLRRVRLLAGIREVPKFHIVKILSRARELLAEVGRELVQAGRLDSADDVFFLDLPEAREAVAGKDLRDAVRDRRATYARELGRKHLPRWILSDGTEPAAPALANQAGDLTGTPASAGTITGRARVVLDPTGARLEPGEILVAPSTDPGWTPLFLTAGGLVMEMGGSMSHGSVVAREYGIPAVVGVAHATERITTGQRITVDGTTGTVRLAPDGDAR